MASQFVDVGKALVADSAESWRVDSLMYGPDMENRQNTILAKLGIDLTLNMIYLSES